MDVKPLAGFITNGQNAVLRHKLPESQNACWFKSCQKYRKVAHGAVGEKLEMLLDAHNLVMHDHRRLNSRNLLELLGSFFEGLVAKQQPAALWSASSYGRSKRSYLYFALRE